MDNEELYHPDRVYRKSDRRQVIPLELIRPTKAKKGRGDTSSQYKLAFKAAEHHGWVDREDHLLDLEEMRPTTH